MAHPTEPGPSPLSVFQAQFGIPPGTLDPRTECANWERLCGELLAERQKLRAELERARLRQRIAEESPIPSVNEVYAQVDRSSSIQAIVADLERELELEK